MSHELKDCPFCGSGAMMAGGGETRLGRIPYQVECSSRLCNSKAGAAWEKESAAHLWNRRAQPASFIASPEALCKGAWELGTACGKCACCIATKDNTGHD